MFIIYKNIKTHYLYNKQLIIQLCFFLLFISLLYYGGLYQNQSSFPSYYILFFFLLLVIFLSFVYSLSSKFVLLITSLIFIIASCITLIFSPHPICDCFTTVKEASQFFLKGINPYGASYSEVYAGVNSNYFPHLPLSFIIVSPFVYLFKDPRISLVVFSLLSSFMLRSILSPKCDPKLINLIIAAFLFFPRSFYMIEHMYQEMTIFMFFLGFVYFIKKDRKRTAFLCLGLFFSFKHHLWLLFPLLMMNKEFRQMFFQQIQVFFIPFLVPVVYAIINPQIFFNNILFFFNPQTLPKILPITRSLSLPTFLYQILQIPLQKAQIISLIVFFLIYFFTLMRSKNLSLSFVYLLLLIHFTFSYSFFNHYYLIMLFLFLLSLSHILNINLLTFTFKKSSKEV